MLDRILSYIEGSVRKHYRLFVVVYIALYIISQCSEDVHIWMLVYILNSLLHP